MQPGTPVQFLGNQKMIQQICRNLTTTALAMTPFLLSGCGPDNDNNKRTALVVTGLMLYIFSMAVGQLKARRTVSTHAA